MYNGKYTGYKDIISEVMRRFPFKNQPTREDAAEAISYVLKTTLPYNELEDDIAIIDITDGCGDLPEDLRLIIRTAVNTGDSKSKPALVPMRWATDSFHLQNHLFGVDYNTVSVFTYELNSNRIYPNFKTGCVWMAYKKIPVDDEGMPKVPDDESFRLACIYSLAHTMALRAVFQQELSDKLFSIVERDKEWYLAQAGNGSKIPSLEEEEANTNAFKRFVSTDVYSTFFTGTTLPEKMAIKK
jgi:hypothetical protein